MQDALQDKFCAFECESGDVEMQWNNIKKGSVNTTSDLLVKVDWGARKPWITQEVISKMDEERKWMSTTKKKKKQKGAKYLPVLTTSRHCPYSSYCLSIKFF